LTEISSLFITFEELYVFPTGDTLPPDSSATPIHLLTGPVTLDILALTNGLSTVLGAGNLPEGDYRAIHILVNEGSSWLIEADGDTHDVKVPSNRLKVITDFTISEGEVTDLVLDLDAAASLIKTGNNVYILRPVIHQVPGAELAASISGEVMVETESGLVSAGDIMVANPRLNHDGEDRGTGNRPGDKNGRGRGRDRRAQVPLTVAFPMIVHASAEGDSTDDDSTMAVRTLNPLDDDDDDDLPPGDPRFHRPRSRGTVVGPDGEYTLWRLRKGGTYELRLHVHPRSGYEVVSGPGTVDLNGNVTGQNFVIREIPAP
jgi:mannose-6-phosphate isomerase-like protein (cupin superfamily)